jgi:hypothetical protein
MKKEMTGVSEWGHGGPVWAHLALLGTLALLPALAAVLSLPK